MISTKCLAVAYIVEAVGKRSERPLNEKIRAERGGQRLSIRTSEHKIGEQILTVSDKHPTILSEGHEKGWRVLRTRLRKCYFNSAKIFIPVVHDVLHDTSTGLAA
jgi:hypothetical protein